MSNIVQTHTANTSADPFPVGQSYMLLTNSGVYNTVSGIATGWAPGLTQTGLNNGDVIRVSQSIGRAGKHMTVTIVGDGLGLALQVAGLYTFFTRRQDPTHEMWQWTSLGFKNMTTGQEVNTNNPIINYSAFGPGSYTFNDIPIDNIVVSRTGGTGSYIIQIT